jgi:hypothetical protein
MKIISHRGYWREPPEKNTEAAFRRSFGLGFGTETDVRDLGGTLVISHDPPLAGALELDAFLELYRAAGGGVPLALNIKADGLQMALKKSLENFGVSDYFVFDMSVPDLLGYHKAGMPFYARMSEYEPDPVLLAKASGVWLDGFHTEWYQDAQILSLQVVRKRACIVSPELHGRPHLPLWQRLRNLEDRDGAKLMLCTDFPEEARSFFVQSPISAG